MYSWHFLGILTWDLDGRMMQHRSAWTRIIILERMVGSRIPFPPSVMGYGDPVAANGEHGLSISSWDLIQEHVALEDDRWCGSKRGKVHHWSNAWKSEVDLADHFMLSSHRLDCSILRTYRKADSRMRNKTLLLHLCVVMSVLSSGHPGCRYRSIMRHPPRHIGWRLRLKRSGPRDFGHRSLK